MNKKNVISHLVAFILGTLGGFLGKDLSGLQKPVEKAAEVAVDAVVKKDEAPASKPVEAIEPVKPVETAAPELKQSDVSAEK